jgi:large repetitive protein
VLIANTSVTLTSSANPATSGLPLTFSTLVTGTGGPVSGSVTFEDGTTILGKSALSASGNATFTTTALAPGQHVITAAYSGDGNNSPNTSPILQQQVQQVTVASLASSANPALTLAPVVITCTVTNGNTVRATGLVTFTDGTSVIGSAALDNNGVATLSLSSLPAGQHSIVAAYSGDIADFPSTSSPLGQIVQLRATSDVLTATNDVITTTTVTSSPTNGEQLTLISVVRWTGPTTPTGSMTFKLGNTVVGTALVDNVGLATLTVVLDPGAAEFVASYSGDSVYSASSSPATPITQGPPTSFTMQLSPPAVTVASKQNTTVTLTLSSLNGFSDTLSLGCLGLPFAATCTFSSDQSGLVANGTQVIHVVIDTGSPLTAGGVAKNDSYHNSSKTTLCFLPCGVLLGWVLMRSRKRRPLIGLLLLLCSIGLTLGLSGCGTLNINGTPAGTYTFKITAAGVNTGVTQSTVVTLTVQ